MTTEYMFLRARAGWAIDALAAIVLPDDFAEFMPPCSYVRYTSDKSIQPQWGGETINHYLVALTPFHRPGTSRKRMCAISAEGNVIFFEEPKFFEEKILGAGIKGPDAKFYGRMDDIAGIGASLFACGDGGQIYKRIGDNDWRCLAPELLRKPHSDDDDEWFVGIGGPTEDDVYFAGKKGHVAHWNGEKITLIETLTKAFLVWVQVENEKSIWIGGAEGTLLHGNARDGFRQIPGIDRGHHLNAGTFFEGRLYIGSSSNSQSGIYVFENGAMKRVQTGLRPEPDDVSFIDAGAGVLWAIGRGKDIVHFDGKKWERIDFPLNTPIR